MGENGSPSRGKSLARPQTGFPCPRDFDLSLIGLDLSFPPPSTWFQKGFGRCYPNPPLVSSTELVLSLKSPFFLLFFLFLPFVFVFFLVFTLLASTFSTLLVIHSPLLITQTKPSKKKKTMSRLPQLVPISIADLEHNAHTTLAINALDYYRSGANDMQTLKDNQDAYSR